MKTTATATGLAAAFILGSFVIGCSWANASKDKPTNAPRANSSANANANKSVSDTVIDTAVGEKTLGVPECDEAFKVLTDYANNPDDNFAVRAGKALMVNKIKESLRTSIEENKADKAELAKACREAKTQFDKYKSDGNANKGR